MRKKKKNVLSVTDGTKKKKEQKTLFRDLLFPFFCNRFILMQKRFFRKKFVFPLTLIGILFSIAIGIFVFRGETTGATFGWIQSSWLGGADTDAKASHNGNQTNWTKYFSKDSNLQVDGNGVSITGTSNSWITTSDSDWNSGTNGGVYVSNGAVYALKPPGAVCSTGTECKSLGCYNTCCEATTCCGTPSGSTCSFNGLTYGVVTAKDGKQWLDRNLGAMRVATSTADSLSYGYYYQWGRGNDGHQLTTSATTSTLSSSDTPGHGNFILVLNPPYDWRDPQNDNLWQGVYGTNNPCPTGFHLPSASEWSALVAAEGITNSATAFSSTLKLPVAGFRNYASGSFTYQGSDGGCWSSSVSGTNAMNLYFNAGNVNPGNSNFKDYGFSVRCVKN